MQKPRSRSKIGAPYELCFVVIDEVTDNPPFVYTGDVDFPAVQTRSVERLYDNEPLLFVASTDYFKEPSGVFVRSSGERIVLYETEIVCKKEV